jgi:hypothetical protein
VAFTTDMSGTKPLDQRLPRLRSAHQTSRMNFENRQVLDQIFRILTDDEYRDAMNDWKNESLAQWGAGKAP